MKNALLYHLTGDVRNLEDGDVEIHIQGTEKNLHAFIHAVSKDNPWIRVDHLTVEEEAPRPQETRFRIDGYF